MEVDIDTTAPLCAHSLQGDLSQSEGRYTTAVNVTLIPTDAGSGAGAAMYRLDGADSQSCTGAISIAEKMESMLLEYCGGPGGGARSISPD